MNSQKNPWITGLVLAVACLLSVTSANAAPITQATIQADWSNLADPITGNNNAAWAFPVSGEVRSSNSNGTLISDFTQTGDATFSVQLTALKGDDDVMGLVFGWQDPQNTYLLTWGAGGVPGWDGPQLTRFDNGVPTQLAGAATPLWTEDVPYQFSLTRTGNQLAASIMQGATTLFSTSVMDTMFLTGNVGFHTRSQKIAFLNTDFTPGGVSSTGAVIPEPAMSLLAGICLGALGVVRGRRRRR